MIEYFNEDCMAGMARYPDKHFDLAIVDPPYGIERFKNGGSHLNKYGSSDRLWNNEKPSQQYFDELFRVSKSQIIWGGNYFNLAPSRCFLVWDKGEGFYGRTYAEAELAWTSFDANVKIFKRDPLAKGDYRGKIHPTQKPVALYKWLLTNYAKPGDLILDTHVGSASSLIACYDLGFDAVGFEIDEEYYRISRERLENHMKQLRFSDMWEDERR